ncbi:MAG: putative acyltransferase [Ilumatobacteraceae bacterium]|nr:putative acyltransferase [Ilumatobacteraceae bacterium]
MRAAAGVLALSAAALTACEPAPVPTRPGTERVVLLGDSIPNWLIRDGMKGVDTTKITLVDGTLEACDGARNNPPARAVTGKVVPTPAACAKGWPSMYPPHLTVHTDVAVVMTSVHAMLDHQLSGTWRHPCHTPARTWYQNDMTSRLNWLKTKAERVVLVLPAWLGTNSGWIMPSDRIARADCVRSVLKAAARSAGVTVVDFGAYLCPTGPNACKPWRTKDGMHIDPVRAPSALGWLSKAVMPPADPGAPGSETAPSTAPTRPSTPTAPSSAPAPAPPGPAPAAPPATTTSTTIAASTPSTTSTTSTGPTTTTSGPPPQDRASSPV